MATGIPIPGSPIFAKKKANLTDRASSFGQKGESFCHDDLQIELVTCCFGGLESKPDSIFSSGHLS